MDTTRRATQGYYTEKDLWILEVVQVEALPKHLFENEPSLANEEVMVRNMCLACGSGNNCKQCGSCKSALFCSVKCQKAIWKFHKDMCGAVTKYTKFNMLIC